MTFPFRVSLLTIESDGTSPELVAAVRELLEHAGPKGVVVVAPTETKRAAEETTPPAREPAPAPAATTAAAAPATSCPRFPPCAGCRKRGACEGSEELAPQPGTHGTRRVEHAIRDLVETEKRAVVAPKPTPAAPVAPTVASSSPSLTERVRAAVRAQSGTSVPTLATMLLGRDNPENRRAIEMALNPLVLRDEIFRANGRLFPTAKNNAAAQAPSTGPMLPQRPRGQAAPLSDVQRKKEAYDAIVAAFTKNNAYPIEQLATEVFGDSTGSSTRKVRLMLLQLQATERLERVGAREEWRPVGHDEQLGRGLDEDTGDEPETESNGAPDDDALEELDLN